MSPCNRCYATPAGRTALVVCDEIVNVLYTPWCLPSSLSAPSFAVKFTVSTANPSLGRGRGSLAASRSRDSHLWRLLYQVSSLIIPFKIREVSSASCAFIALYCTDENRRSRSRCCPGDIGLF